MYFKNIIIILCIYFFVILNISHCCQKNINIDIINNIFLNLYFCNNKLDDILRYKKFAKKRKLLFGEKIFQSKKSIEYNIKLIREIEKVTIELIKEINNNKKNIQNEKKFEHCENVILYFNKITILVYSISYKLHTIIEKFNNILFENSANNRLSPIIEEYEIETPLDQYCQDKQLDLNKVTEKLNLLV